MGTETKGARWSHCLECRDRRVKNRVTRISMARAEEATEMARTLEICVR